MKKAFVLLLCVILFAVPLTGCGNSNPGPTPQLPTEEPSSIPTPELPAEIPASPDTSSTPDSDPASTAAIIDPASAYGAYLRVFRDYDFDMAAYDWGQNENTVAICDVFGDETPEFLFISVPLDRERDGAYLSIYAYQGGFQAHKVYYNKLDIVAGSGSYYCLFTSDQGKLFLYMREQVYKYSFDELELNADNQLVSVNNFVRESMPSEDHTTYTHAFTHNGAEIDEGQFLTLVDYAVEDVKDIVLWSCTKADEYVWSKMGEVDHITAMPVGDAAVYLGSSAGEIKPNVDPIAPGTPFAEEQAIAIYLVPYIASEWEGFITREWVLIDTTFKLTPSDKLYDDQPIYLAEYSIVNIGEGLVLVFSDGRIIDNHDLDFDRYAGYFDIDITSY